MKKINWTKKDTLFVIVGVIACVLFNPMKTTDAKGENYVDNEVTTIEVENTIDNSENEICEVTTESYNEETFGGELTDGDIDKLMDYYIEEELKLDGFCYYDVECYDDSVLRFVIYHNGSPEYSGYFYADLYYDEAMNR